MYAKLHAGKERVCGVVEALPQHVGGVCAVDKGQVAVVADLRCVV